jgi:hypothetical protein
MEKRENRLVATLDYLKLSIKRENATKPEFLNFYGAQESIPRNQFRHQPM